MQRMLAPSSIAIVGLSNDPSKHGGRVLANLRKVGFQGRIVGVNPRRPEVAGVEVVGAIGDLTDPPDLVVCAVPAIAIPGVVAESSGAGGVVVFAGGFAEAGEPTLQRDLVEAAERAGVSVLGPNSGGIIRPAAGLAASFLTCLDRPAEQIRSGPVGLVTQSGGTGSYVHNLAAGAGSGLGASISTGNEAVLGLADGISALCDLPEIRVIALVLETVRDGVAFLEAVEAARRAGKAVVACRIGSSRRGAGLMGTHTGAMAVPVRVLDGVLEAAGVTVAETPEEMLAVAEVLARSGSVGGGRLGIVTHSGGIAILLSDLAERHGVELPHPSDELRERLSPLLQQGSSDNPLDMGGIIGGPGRFARVVDLFAASGDFDCVLAVSTAHPPAHTVERVRGLLELDPPVPVIHLWMAGDVGGEGLEMLRTADRAVVTEPRAAMRAMAALPMTAENPMVRTRRSSIRVDVPPTEHAAKELLAAWNLPVVEGGLAMNADEAVAVAARLGGPVAIKVSSAALTHKTEAGGVRLGVAGDEAVRRAFDEIVEGVGTAHPGIPIDGVRVERMAGGFEVIVGLFDDPVFGAMAMVGPGGVGAEGMGLERFAPAPMSTRASAALIGGVPGMLTALGRLGPGVADELAGLVSMASEAFAGTDLAAMEMNPIAWSKDGWHILDVVVVSGRAEGEDDGTTR